MIVLYMIAMANVCWIATRNMEYWNQKYGIVFKSGETYFGIPYSQYLRNTNLETFKRLIKNGKYFGTSGFNHTSPEGSDCSSAVSMAWQLLNKNIPYLSTYEMLPNSENPYIVKVGEYKVPEKATTSTDVINSNTKETIYEAYTKLQPGDAVVSRSRGGGHVILVREVNVKNQAIIGIDQEGVDENGVLKGKNGKSSWKDDRRLTFAELYSKNYIPITINELVGKA